MNRMIKLARVFVIGCVALWLVPLVFVARVRAGDVAVRSSAMTGVADEDLGPGWHWRIPGLHKIHVLPTHYDFLDYSEEDSGEALLIRTKDNNNVYLDVSVAVRIRPGEGHAIVARGNHLRDADGRFRYQRLARETTISVLREELAALDSVAFYTTARRLEVAGTALERLNKELAPQNLEAQAVLIRAVGFREDYERQLQQIQLNEQNKLLDAARQKVAERQQALDNYQNGTQALAAAREQDWQKRLAELERAYQVGFVDTRGDGTPGASRKALAALDEAGRAALRARAAAVFGFDQPDAVTEAYLLGIKNLQAETLEYRKRITAAADGVAARLAAEGDAEVARVRGDYEAKLNALLNSPAGRAFVAWKAADNVSFAEALTFSSRDGIPSVLRLRAFALAFMGGG